MEKPFLTIIVPAYNVELYLRQCLESLIHQTMMAHKVIVINDGSKDSTGKIAEEYANSYPDIIQYYSQKNRGLGAARNVGLARANTPYVTFLDSDDWLMPTFVENVIKRLNQEKEIPDIIFTLPFIYDMATNKTGNWMDKPLFDVIFDPGDKVVNPDEDPRIYGLEPNACRRVYSVRFLEKENFTFPEGTKWEDVEPHFYLLHKANRCIAVHSVGFFYRINSGNQITSDGGPGRLQVVSVFSRCLFKAINEEWKRIEISYILRMMLSFTKWSIDCIYVNGRKELIKRLHILYRSIPKSVLTDYYEDMNVWKNDKMLIMLLRSKFFALAGTAEYYDIMRSVMRKFISHNK